MNSILIAEDNRDFALSLQLALEAAGYAVRVAENAREAIALQRVSPAEALITDLIMPEGDGFEAIDAFRKEFPATKLIVISGAEKLNAARYLAAAHLIGADATLQKPFEVDALLEILRAL
ncbi:MAG TPA: response regulator [Burkholderiales bacterium]